MEILQRFKRIIAEQREAPVVFELGCCDGYHSNKMIEVIKERERPFIFHGFEPNSDLHPKILNSIKGHLMFNCGIIGIFPHAVGAFQEERRFYKSGGVKVDENGKEVDWYFGSSSIRKPKDIYAQYPDMTFTDERVFVTTLDAHLMNHNYPWVDFIWSDIQGAELDMIKGGREALKKTRYLYTEYINTEHYEGQGIGLQSILKLLPDFKIVEDYQAGDSGDVLLRNAKF